jgi:ADP-heptose:LPS heptosyltransferase
MSAMPQGPTITGGGQRILVLHPGALGDVLQAVPALRALGRLGRVTLAGQGRLAALLRDTGASAEALTIDTLGLQAMFTADLPAPPALTQFSTIVAWFGSTDPTFSRRLAGLAARSVVASPTGAASDPRPVWRHLLETLGPLGVSSEPADLEPLSLPSGWRERARGAVTALGLDRDRPLLVVHPGAGGAWKLWPPERFAEVIARVVRQTGAQPIVHQGPADREAAERLHALLDGRTPRLVEPDLPLLAATLGETAGYLGGDSGVSQLAAAVGAPAVIVYPRETRERWEPWSPTALAIADGGDPGQPAEVGRLLGARISDRPTGRPGASRPSSRASP